MADPKNSPTILPADAFAGAETVAVEPAKPDVPAPRSGVLYQGRPVEELSREELLALVIGQDFVLQRLFDLPGRAERPAVIAAQEMRTGLKTRLGRHGHSVA